MYVQNPLSITFGLSQCCLPYRRFGKMERTGGGPGIKMIKLEQLPLLSNRTMDCLKMQEMYEESSRRNT